MVNESTKEGARVEEPAAQEENAAQLEVERRGFSLGRSLRDPRTLISFALAIAIILFVFRGFNIDLAQTWQYMRGANPALLLTALVVFYMTFPLRALRWRMLLRNAEVPVDQGRKTWASMPALMEYMYLSWFANCIVPAKLGDAYRGYLLKRNGQVSFSATFGTIFAERLLDMLGLFSFLVISGWFVFGTRLPPQTNLIFISGLVLVAVIVSGLAGMRWFSPLLRRVMPQRLHRVYGQFEQAALRSFQPRILPRLALLTGAIWLLEGFRLYFVIQALEVEGLQLALPVIIFVALASSLLTAVPLTPAGLGVVEGAVTAVLVLFLPSATELQAASSHSLALAVTFLDRAINFWSIVVFGLLLYIFSKRK
jgi:glycosyltransferase 2 family protein